MVKFHGLSVQVGSLPRQERARLVLVHIPKTGGSAVTAWASSNKLSLESRHMERCNSTRRERGKPVGSVSMKHCINSYEKMTADRESGFCVLRDPLQRAVSSYNMLPLLPSTCDPAHLEKAIGAVLANGHSDNHDLPQHLYARYCRFVLCFERLDADFALLLREQAVRRIVNPSSSLAKSIFTGCRGAAASALRASAPCATAEKWLLSHRNQSRPKHAHDEVVELLWPLEEAANFSGFPRVRPASLGQRVLGVQTLGASALPCNTSHLSNRTRAALLERSRQDVALREAHSCHSTVSRPDRLQQMQGQVYA